LSNARQSGFHPVKFSLPFVSADWELVTVDALVSSGKWFSAGWRRQIGVETWFLAFGRSGDSSEILTVYRTSRGDAPLSQFKNALDIVQPDDPFYVKVDRVNRELLPKVEGLD
jgi:hypothetical protein